LISTAAIHKTGATDTRLQRQQTDNVIGVQRQFDDAFALE
jgi:hypothetical protein